MMIFSLYLVKMLKKQIYVMRLPHLVLIFLALVDKVVVDIYARFQLSIKHICEDFHISLEKY